MDRFAKKLCILVLVTMLCAVLIICFHYYIIGSQYQYNYMAAARDKIHRLNSINEPKIILVGSSNLAFGIDSPLIEQETGMPVVNLGLQGSLGNEYHERMAWSGINPGDIVVVCHTNYSDEDEIGNAVYALMAWDCNNEMLPMFRIKDIPDVMLAYPTFFRGAFSLWIGGNGNEDVLDIYSRGAFNEYGDVVYKPDYGQLSAEELFEGYTYYRRINDICIDRLNELNSYAISRGASMVIAAHPIGYGVYSDFTAMDYVEYRDELDEALECDVISDYTDYFFPYEYFYNTPLHLNEMGTCIRSRQLSADINNWLKDQPRN